jgi:hypothetical protein
MGRQYEKAADARANTKAGLDRRISMRRAIRHKDHSHDERASGFWCPRKAQLWDLAPGCMCRRESGSWSFISLVGPRKDSVRR